MKINNWGNPSPLLVIVSAQFFCTSMWFAGNAVMPDLLQEFSFANTIVGWLTSAVQFGFISGTLTYALFNIADRFSPSRVFFFSALAAAFFNLGILASGQGLVVLLFSRFLTGFFLAGIYPVGMKIAADYFQQGLGKALGFLVGALVLGTAFPHLLRTFDAVLSWKYVVICTSMLSILGGVLILLLVPDGPYRKPSQKLEWQVLPRIFQNRPFRAAAMGYFGHMWELYTFWAFVPFLLSTFEQYQSPLPFSNSLLSFGIIGVGSVACIAGGYLSQHWGAALTASWALSLSGICCVLSPFFIWLGIEWLFITFLLFWGMVVIADSPLFSTLVAQNAPAQWKGTALTIVNCIGFAITILSIQLLQILQVFFDPRYIMVFLAIGPLIGWWFFHKAFKIKI